MAALAVAITFAAVTAWLLGIAGDATAGTARASARIDAVRTGLAAGGGTAAAFGLLLAFRRQHHHEVASMLSDLDASEKRITELYAKATEQLGNPKAPVRLGGLYALERLAQDNPVHRQTAVNVICAYLRMPLAPAEMAPTAASVAGTQSQTDHEPPPTATTTARDEERQVRLTAQRILSSHLHRTDANIPHSYFWADTSLDLAGAVLEGFDLGQCQVESVDFDGATFYGAANFTEVVFNGNASFVDASFREDVDFDEATFMASASFAGSTFGGLAPFASVKFRDAVTFDRAVFEGYTARGGAVALRHGGIKVGPAATFVGTMFDGPASFSEVTFRSVVHFGRSRFNGSARFTEAKFEGLATFREMVFADCAFFQGASFLAEVAMEDSTSEMLAWFSDAKFESTATFARTTFRGQVLFNDATFHEDVMFQGAQLNDPDAFVGARVLSHSAECELPPEWRLVDDVSGGRIIVRADPHAVD